MDGIDGLVAGCMTVAFVSAFFMGEIYLIGFIGGLIAFLLWNWSPAKLFMGDIGSTSLGALLIFIILNLDSSEKIIALIMITSPILLDAFTCLVRRFSSSQNIFRAHSLHLYQRLNKAGLSHSSFISILFITSSVLISFSYFYGGLFYVFISTGLVLLLGIWLDKFIATSFDG